MSDNEGAKSSRDAGTTLVPVLAQIPPAPLVPWVAPLPPLDYVHGYRLLRRVAVTFRDPAIPVSHQEIRTSEEKDQPTDWICSRRQGRDRRLFPSSDFPPPPFLPLMP